MIKHGHTSGGIISPEYHSWASMKKRCLNTKSKFYPYYGGRGIYICDKWMSFDGFLEDMKLKPKGTSLERIDNNKGYSVDNCKWANMIEQQNNKRNNILLTYNGETKNLSQWANNLGITTKLLYQRLYRDKWSVERALNNPSLSRNTSVFIEVEGKLISLYKYCKDKNLPYETIRRRVNNNKWTLEKALGTPLKKKIK